MRDCLPSPPPPRLRNLPKGPSDTGEGVGSCCSCGSLTFGDIHCLLCYISAPHPFQDSPRCLMSPCQCKFVSKGEVPQTNFLLGFCFLAVWTPWRKSAGCGKRTKKGRGKFSPRGSRVGLRPSGLCSGNTCPTSGEQGPCTCYLLILECSSTQIII